MPFSPPPNVPPTLSYRLRSSVGSALADMNILVEAADEIDRLEQRIRELVHMRSPEGAKEQGYKEAQRDIRKALGIEED